MQTSRRLRFGAANRSLAAALAAWMLLTGALVPAAQAAVVTSEAALATSGAGDADRARVAGFLGRQDVRGQLEALGVDPDQARERVASLTDAEAASLAGKLDALPAGGSAALGLAIAALVIVLVIALELMGIIDIFPQIGSRR